MGGGCICYIYVILTRLEKQIKQLLGHGKYSYSALFSLRYKISLSSIWFILSFDQKV